VPLTVLEQPVWRSRRAEHEARVDAWLAGHRERRQHAVKHPVEDFLFTYYSFRPARLRRWHPGAGVVLRGTTEFGPRYRDTPEGSTVDVDAIMGRRRESIERIRQLLASTGERTGFFGCFGMHEWAMVYRQTQEQVRHNAWPLRLSPGQTAEVVESTVVRCSHFDAFRFFTAPARSLNVLSPTRESQIALEQPACLHANMDLYKWCYKLVPLIPSELMADCFALARDIRALDMRASPYDLSALGFDPVRVESAEGRAQYVAAQRDFAERAAPLRQRLIESIDVAFDACPQANFRC
jgi:hypothetical protein